MQKYFICQYNIYVFHIYIFHIYIYKMNIHKILFVISYYYTADFFSQLDVINI